MSRRTRGDKYQEARVKLIDPNLPASEQEQIILSLLNDQNTEAYHVLGEYLVAPEVVFPTRYIQNYRGDFLHSIRTLIPDHLARFYSTEPNFIEETLLKALNQLYTFEDMRTKLFSAFVRLKLSQKAANQLLSILWSESPPITVAKEILFEMLQYLDQNVQSNHLFWFLFTPADYLTLEFPKIFHEDIFALVMKFYDEYQALLMLVQAIGAGLNKSITYWSQYPGNYLKVFTEGGLAVLLTQKSTLQLHPNKAVLIQGLHDILKMVSQADDPRFLQTFIPDVISKGTTEELKKFIEHWQDHILGRFLLRSQVLELLNDLNDVSANYIIEIIEQSAKYQTLDDVIKIEAQLMAQAPKYSPTNQSPMIIFRVEILLELLDWDFEAVLEGVDFARLDFISNLLTRIPRMLNLEENISLTPEEVIASNQSDKLTQLLFFSCKKAVREYWYRKGLIQQIYKSTAFHEQLSQLEAKYHQFDSEPIPKREMYFQTLNDLIMQQKNRILQLMFTIDQHLVTKFIDKLQLALARLYSHASYYIIYHKSMNPQDPRSYNSSSSLQRDPLITEKLIDFYRYFEGMLTQEIERNQLDSLGYRRIDAAIDLLNDFIKYNGHLDFEPEFYNTENM